MYTQEIHSEVVNDNYHSVYVIIISEQPLKAKLITTEGFSASLLCLAPIVHIFHVVLFHQSFYHIHLVLHPSL